MRYLIFLFLGFFFLNSAAQPVPELQHPVLKNAIQKIEAFQREERRLDSASGFPLGLHGEANAKRSHDFYAALDQEISSIQGSGLSFADEINAELLRYSFEDEIADFKYRSYLNPILSEGGFHTNITGISNTAIRSSRDAKLYLEKLKDLPRYMREHFDLMRQGLLLGIAQPVDVVKSFNNTYEVHIVSNPENSIFFKPFNKKPTTIPEDEWNAILLEARKTIDQYVVAAYKEVKTFFEKEYLTKAPQKPGALHMPDGIAFYQNRVRHFTTTDLRYDSIYAIGMREVTRIQQSMQSVMKEVGFTGDLKAFIQMLRTNPAFYPKSGDELLKEASFIAKKIDGKLPTLFGRLPRQPYGIEPVPAEIAPTYTAGRYSPASIKSTRAGNYWVNLYNLPSRTLYTLEALTLHEAVPGHHLQMSLTQELEHLPAFRRNLYVNAFGEGWGLYAESLGYEIGLYKDPYSRFGQLTYDMWRACRLVIDVGIHAKGWSRQEAVDFLAKNSALSLHEVNTEINRYIAWPGQALAYKMGELKIKELRKKAESALGNKFDVRSFHDQLLSEGTLTLRLMEKLIDKYIETNK
ncbi:MAG: hypothetical protein RL131_983 [Bacteroidota bacterium]